MNVRKALSVVKRYIINTVGLYVMTFAIRLTVKTGLGTTPLSTLPNVFSYRFPSVSFGTLTLFWNLILILTQILLLRRKFHWIQLLQIPLTFLFSLFLDINGWLIEEWPSDSWWLKAVYIVFGIIILAFSISLTVQADVVMNSGEAVVKALAETIHKPFGHMKVLLDILYVLLGTMFSLLFFGVIRGVGIGTLALAVCTGLVVNWWNCLLERPLQQCFQNKKALY